MGKLFKQFKLDKCVIADGAELSIIDSYTDRTEHRTLLSDSELEGLYNILKEYLEDKGIISDDDEGIW